MKITLFRDMKAEGWPSMDRYADSLTSQFSMLWAPAGQARFQFSIFVVEPPVNRAKVRMFWRRQVYPRLARLAQGEVNHVLDHSYAGLLDFLDLQKTVITCHDLLPLTYEPNAVVRNQFRQTVQKLPLAKLIIADSQSTKTDLQKFLGVVDEKIKVIYLGVSDLFKPLGAEVERSTLRQRLGLPEGKIILSLGDSRLSYKNLEGVLKAFAKVMTVRGDAYLLRINGLSPSQLELSRRLHLGHRLIQIDRPSDLQLRDLYNCADVFLCPSFREGFGLPVLEALACGTPVIVSKGSSLEEIAGSVGIYVDPSDGEQIAEVTLKTLKRDSAVLPNRDRLLAQARLFSWNQTARQTYAVYQQVFDRKL